MLVEKGLKRGYIHGGGQWQKENVLQWFADPGSWGETEPDPLPLYSSQAYIPTASTNENDPPHTNK